MVNGKKCVNFASFNFLGLLDDPRVKVSGPRAGGSRIPCETGPEIDKRRASGRALSAAGGCQCRPAEPEPGLDRGWAIRASDVAPWR